MNHRIPDPPPPLTWRNIEAIPLIHGRMAFAIEVRRRMLAERHAVLALELPGSLRTAVLSGVERLPRVHAVLYRETPPFLHGSEEFGSSTSALAPSAWYVPIDPCDGMIEAIRIAMGERISIEFIDAEVEQFAEPSLILPDPHAIHGLGIDRYFQEVFPRLKKPPSPRTSASSDFKPRPYRPSKQDLVRESHMAARLRTLSERVGNRGRILFLCGLAHWPNIRAHLAQKTGELHEAEGPSPEWIEVVPVHPNSLVHLLGEMPFSVWNYEQHRSSLDPGQHDPILGVKELLLAARESYLKVRKDSLEQPTPAALRALLKYARRLTVTHSRLSPDLYTLVVAAKGVIGNDFALALIDAARRYPPNGVIEPVLFDPKEESPPKGEEEEEAAALVQEEDTLELQEDQGRLREQVSKMTSRVPGAFRELRRVRLETPPPRVDRQVWRTAWNPFASCSWPPEDVLIENLRSYVSKRSLAMAGIDRVRTERFVASMMDGLAVRETIRDLPLKRLHVKVEPRVPGRVGAVVLIFEEDDDGTKYPWRMTWMAEHKEESTLSFYATNFLDHMAGPGIGRAIYGGCMMIFPPILIEDIWEDLRFERARRPSERLLLAALYHTEERFVAFVSARPPAPEVKMAAAAMGKHIVHLPLTSFSSRTLEKIRHFHVLNGKAVRSWASRYIR